MTITKRWALGFGIFFILLGVLPRVGFFSDTFSVNTLGTIIFIITGVAALILMRFELLARLYFQITGVFYALLTMLGFVYMNDMIMGVLANAMGNNIVYLGVAIIALYFGFPSTERASK